MSTSENNEGLTRLGYVQLFKDTLVEFFDELIEQFPKRFDFIISRIFVKDKLPIQDILDRVVVNIHEFEIAIDNKDAEKLKDVLNNKNMGISKTGKKINSMFKLWSKMDKDDQEVMWKWFKTFLTIAQKYTTAE